MTTTERDLIADALKEAKRTIRIWHGFIEYAPNEAEAWRLYQNSPEMKKINEAIKLIETLISK